MKKRILIVYATYGNGHKAIANYISKYFKEKNSELEILSLDLLNYARPITGKLSKKISEELMHKYPKIWNLIFNFSDHKLSSEFSSKITMHIFKSKKLENLIREFNPDLTIATHFYGTSVISKYNKKNVICSKLISIVTDYEAHEIWLNNYNFQDYLIVCSKNEMKELVKRGFAKEKIKPYGIPINPLLNDEIDSYSFLKKLNLNPHFKTCVCFAGGGSGSTAILPYLKNIIKLNLDLNLILISGNNSKILTKLKDYVQKYDNQNCLVYGFVNNVPEILQNCDFVVTKPGGAQTTECLYFKKPMLLIKSSGGQENANVSYFVKNGYAKMFKNPRRLRKYLANLENHERELQKMTKKLNQNNNNEAMKNLYELTIKVLKKKN